jgi:hypothetical protein
MINLIMAQELLPRTELPLRNRTLHAAHFRKGSKNVDAKARNIPKNDIS